MSRNFKFGILAAVIVIGAYLSGGQMPKVSETACELLFAPNPESGKTVPYLRVLMDAEEFDSEDVVVWVKYEEFIAPDSISLVEQGENRILNQLDFFVEELNLPGRGVSVEWLHGERPLLFLYTPSQFKREYLLSYTCPDVELQIDDEE